MTPYFMGKDIYDSINGKTKKFGQLMIVNIVKFDRPYQEYRNRIESFHRSMNN